MSRHLVLSSTDAREVVRAGSELFTPHRLRSRGVDAALAALPLEQVTLIAMRYRHESIVQPAHELGYYAVHLPVRGRARVHFRGEDVVTGPGNAVVFNPADRPIMHWSADLGQLAVTVPAESMACHLAKLAGRPGRRLVFDHQAGSGRTVHRDSWMNVLRMVVATADASPHRSLPRRVTLHLEDMLLTSLLMSQPSNWTAELWDGDAPAVPDAITQAAEMIEAQPEELWTMAALAAATGTGIRSLQQGFRRVHGVPPMTFLRDTRLDVARRRLADPRYADESIAQIAYGVGFLHPGRFALAFRKRFAIKPSEVRRPINR